MSRALLFKGKRKSDGEWIEGGYFQEDYTDKEYIICWNSTGLGYNEFFEVCSETVCQYTGLTDKNGNRIWENDVVRYYDDLANMNKEDLVKWNETHASFVRLHKSKMGLQYLYIDECIANRCEVIGNIFDNPELLEGSDE